MYESMMVNGLHNIKNTENGIYLHNASFPFEEAKARLNKLALDEESFLIILGNGMGYIIEEAKKKYGVKNFLVIEPNRQIIELSYLRASTLELAENCSLNIFFAAPENFSGELLRDLFLLNARKNSAVVEAPYFKNFSPEFYAVVCREITARQREVEGILSALSGNEIIDVRRALINAGLSGSMEELK